MSLPVTATAPMQLPAPNGGVPKKRTKERTCPCHIGLQTVRLYGKLATIARFVSDSSRKSIIYDGILAMEWGPTSEELVNLSAYEGAVSTPCAGSGDWRGSEEEAPNAGFEERRLGGGWRMMMVRRVVKVKVILKS